MRGARKLECINGHWRMNYPKPTRKQRLRDLLWFAIDGIWVIIGIGAVIGYPIFKAVSILTGPGW